MSYRVVRHPPVRDYLSTITIFIGEYAGYDIAEGKITAIETTLLSFRDFPHVGTVRNEIYPGLRVIPPLERQSSALPSPTIGAKYMSFASVMAARIEKLG